MCSMIRIQLHHKNMPDWIKNSAVRPNEYICIGGLPFFSSVFRCIHQFSFICVQFWGLFYHYEMECKQRMLCEFGSNAFCVLWLGSFYLIISMNENESELIYLYDVTKSNRLHSYKMTYFRYARKGKKWFIQRSKILNDKWINNKNNNTFSAFQNEKLIRISQPVSQPKLKLVDSNFYLIFFFRFS